jgi:hypothetical protein
MEGGVTNVTFCENRQNNRNIAMNELDDQKARNRAWMEFAKQPDDQRVFIRQNKAELPAELKAANQPAPANRLRYLAGMCLIYTGGNQND